MNNNNAGKGTERIVSGVSAASSSNSNSAQGTEINQRIINVMDKSIVGDYLSEANGVQTVVNIIKNNRDTIRNVLNS